MQRKNSSDKGIGVTVTKTSERNLPNLCQHNTRKVEFIDNIINEKLFPDQYSYVFKC